MWVIKSVFDEYNFTWDPPGYHADLYDLDGHYADLGHQFWVFETDGQIVGTVALEFHDRIKSAEQTVEIDGMVRLVGTDCSLNRLYVHPDGRRRGVGHQLVQRVIDVAKSRQRVAMEIWSDKRFVDAHRLYERVGAKVVSERICDDPDVSPEWGLILRL